MSPRYTDGNGISTFPGNNGATITEQEKFSLKQDVIQAWKLAGDETADGIAHGALLNLTPPAVVLGNDRRWILEPDKEYTLDEGEPACRTSHSEG